MPPDGDVTIVKTGEHGEESHDDSATHEVGHELGKHDAQIEQHETAIGEIKSWMETVDNRLDAALTRTAEVPQELWDKVNSLEAKAQTTAETLAEQTEETVTGQPEEVTVPKTETKTDNAPPKKIHPIHGFFRRLV